MRIRSITQTLAGAILLANYLVSGPARAEKWVEDSFEDFADGRLDAGGQNIYVARDGTVRTIHRFDLDQDGYIDLLFNCTHDLIGILPSTVAWLDSERKAVHAPLAVEGSIAVALGDLNRDGHPDAVFCPNRQGVQNPRRFVTIIWGGNDGWPASRSNGVLPVYDATAIALPDLNRDGWPDIATLNGAAWLPGQGEGRIVRVFWGGERGYLLSHYQDFGVPNALDMDAGDFDGDGFADLALLKSDHTLEIVWAGDQLPSTLQPGHVTLPLPGEGERCAVVADYNADGLPDLLVGTNAGLVFTVAAKPGRSWAEPVKTRSFDASHIAAGDLDGDGRVDLVLTQVAIAHASGGEATGADKDQTGHVRILWGEDAGFNAAASTELDVPDATAAASGDLDADGRTDLAIAVYQSAETFAASGIVFFGNGTRALERDPQAIPVSGATDVAIAPPEGTLPARLVFCNSTGGTVNERVPSYLYFGGPQGFGADHRLLIPFVSGYEASAADLNQDGWTDLISMCSGHLGPGAEGLVELGANIFWGRPGGFDPQSKPTVLREYNLFSSNVADFNRDGYLDLVLGAFDPPKPGEPDLLVIYYGGSEGFSRERRTALPSEGRSAICTVADFNRDEWLDIAVSSYNRDLVRIFWGGSAGFSRENHAQLAAPQPIEMETADLNADGFLDLIVGSYNDKVAQHFDTGTLIFWGSDTGFHEWNAQWLPGSAPVGYTVADFDADGYLDLFSPHYHADLTRENLPSYLYWGGPDGFDTRTRTVFVCDSPSDGLAADFDKDGKLDLAVSCHTRDGNHATDSKVFYNDGNRFANPRITLLPAAGPHWMWTEDMGHIYSRQWRQTYESSILLWQTARRHGSLETTATLPEGTTLQFEVRSAPEASSLDDTPWRPVKNREFRVSETDRALHYRATFLSDNGDRYPVLDRVSIELTP